jgi:hypothetical protein
MTGAGDLPSIEDLTGAEPEVSPEDLRAAVLHTAGLTDSPTRRRNPDAPHGLTPSGPGRSRQCPARHLGCCPPGTDGLVR